MSILDDNVTPMPSSMLGIGVDEEEAKRQTERLKQSVEKKKEEEAAKVQQDAENMRPVPNPIQEAGTAVIGGVVDFVEDVDSKIPWLNFSYDWSPQNQTGWGKALRGITSLVVPSIALAVLTRKGIRGGANKAFGEAKVKALPGPVKAIGEFGVDAAAGAAVDAINRESDGDNLARILRDNLPEQFGWLPDNITTLDTDSPDVKRQKNIIEGVGSGALIDTIGWAVKGLRRLGGKPTATKINPLDEKAKKFQEGLDSRGKKKTDEPQTLDEAVQEGQQAAEDVKFERGKRAIEQDPDGLMPDPDVNTPIFDDYEQAVITKPKDAARQSDIDNARIREDIDTADGRLGPVMDSNDYPVANATDPTGIQARRELIEQQAVAGRYDVETMNGRKLTHEQILAAYDDDLKTFLQNPTEESFKRYKKLLEESKVQWQAFVESGMLDNVGFNAAVRSVRTILDNLNPEIMRASGRLQRTTAGQISDMVTATRKMQDAGLDTTRQEQLLLEMSEFLMGEINFASYARGRGLQLLKLSKEELTPDVLANIEKEVGEAMARTKVDAKQFVQQIAKLKDEDPTNYKMLMDAFEASDGKVESIEHAYRFASQLLDPRQMLFKGRGEASSLFAKGLWGFYYNGILSSTATPLRAATGNIMNQLIKDFSYVVGSKFFSKGDKVQMKRALIRIGATWEGAVEGFHHMAQVWNELRIDPDSVKYAVRETDVKLDKLKMQAAESFALAQAKEGNYAPLFKYRIVETLDRMNRWVGFRYSTNAMTAMDAFTRALLAVQESKSRALMQLIDANPNKIDFTPDEIEIAAKAIRKEMYGPDGYIKDEAIEKAARELTLNLDNDASQAVNKVLEAAPILRTLVTFPRTSLNALNFAINSSSISRTPLIPWATDAKRILQADKNLDLDLATKIMEEKGRVFSKAEWDALVVETRGRLAVGDFVTMAAIMSALMGNITGNGPATEKERRTWQQVAGWQPRSIKIGNTYVSYDALEPFATYLSIVADMVNMSSSGTSAPLAEMFDKASMIVSMSIADKTMLTGFKPLIEMLAGNDKAMAMYLGTQANIFMAPWSGLRNQLTQIMTPGLRELEQEAGYYIRNRNGFLDKVGIGEALPFAHDPFDGTVVRDANLLQRVVNFGTPFRFTQSKEPHRRWLMEIGYDAMPVFRENQYGQPYTPKEASMLAKIMGEQKILDKRIKELYKSDWAQKNSNFYKRQRLNNVSTEELPNDQLVFDLITKAFNDAKRAAEAQMYSMPEFQVNVQQGIRARQLRAAQKSGNTQAIQELLSIPK